MLLSESIKYLLAGPPAKATIQLVSRRNRAYRASISNIKREIYARQYPTTLVNPDGSSIRIMYHEPVSVIKLPVDLAQLDEAERKKRLLKRQLSSKSSSSSDGTGKKAVTNRGIDFQKDVKFDPKKYINIAKKK